MSTATTQLDRTRADVPFVRLINVELRKAVDTLAGRWMLIVIALLTLIVDLIVVAISNAADFELKLSSLLWSQKNVMLPIVAAMAILLATSEWTQRTAMVTFTLVPDRWKTIAAKSVVALVLGTAAFALSLAIGGLLTFAGGQWDLSFSDVFVRYLTWIVFLAQALGLGYLFLNSAAAIVTFYALFVLGTFIVAPIVGPLLGLKSQFVQSTWPWIDLYRATFLTYHSDGWPTGELWGQLVTSTLIWVGIPLGIGAWRVLTAEVK
jgi:ABC-2 type transport system permease protein